MFDAISRFASELFTLETLGAHWPYFAMLISITWVGFATESNIFTRERAYLYRGRSFAAKAQQAFWYWGRETLAYHPILVSLLLAFLWPDPELRGFRPAETVGYWISCGLVGQALWVAGRAYLKRKGIVLHVPGDTDRPPPAQRNTHSMEIPIGPRPTEQRDTRLVNAREGDANASEGTTFEERITTPDDKEAP